MISVLGASGASAPADLDAIARLLVAGRPGITIRQEAPTSLPAPSWTPIPVGSCDAGAAVRISAGGAGIDSAEVPPGIRRPLEMGAGGGTGSVPENRTGTSRLGLTTPGARHWRAGGTTGGNRPISLLLVLLTLPLSAQTPPLPTELLAAGAGYNRASSPQVAGWASYAHAVTRDVYSFSTYEVGAAKGTPFRAVTSTRTGFALLLRTLGPVALLALGDAGVAVAGKMDGTAVGGSFSGGGVAAVSLGKGWWIIGAVRQTKTALSEAQPVVELGIGWGK